MPEWVPPVRENIADMKDAESLPCMACITRSMARGYWPAVCYVKRTERDTMAKVCKFCRLLNSYVCGEPDDCVQCGQCAPISKEDKENRKE